MTERKTIPLNNKFQLQATTVSPSRVPQVGLSIFEVSSDKIHPGTQIFNLLETADMNEQEIFDLVKGLDERALANMPQELLDEIKSGNIEHIFQTDPTTTTKFNDLPIDEQERIIREKKGSIYFRAKDGKTARFKLPDVAGDDAGWNANKGGAAFMDAAVYDTPDNVADMNRAANVQKQINRGTLGAQFQYGDDVRNLNVVGDILSGSPTVGALPAATASPAGGPTAVSSPPSSGSTTSGNPPAQPTAPEPVPTKPRQQGGVNVGTPVESFGEPLETPEPARVPRATVNTGTQSTQTTASGGMPSRGTSSSTTRRGMQNAANASSAVASGLKGAKNLRLTAAAAAVGLGAYGVNKFRNRDVEKLEIQKRIEMDRRIAEQRRYG
jgi:hypothetical protein